MTQTVSAAPAFKNALVTLIRTAINDSTVLVTYGHPGLEVADDMVGVQKITSQQVIANMGARRSREETLTAEVIVSCYRGGGPEVEQVAGDRAYQLLGLIEQYVRVTDTTVGGTVRDCFLISHDSQGATDPALIAEGRVIEITATFEAHARITS